MKRRSGKYKAELRSLHDDDVLDDPRIEFVEHRVEINEGRNPVGSGTRQLPDARAAHARISPQLDFGVCVRRRTPWKTFRNRLPASVVCRERDSPP